MHILLDVKNIALIITAILNFALGLIIFFNGRHKRINKLYAWNILAIISWAVAMVLFRSASQEVALLWCFILYITPTLIASSFLYFTYIFPSQREENLDRRALLIFGGNLIIILMTAVPGLILKQVNLRHGLENEIIFGSFYILYFLYIAIYFSYGFLRLFKKILKSIGNEKTQVIYLLIGYALAANLAFITNLLMPWMGYFFLNWLGQIFTILMVSFTTYAIVVHRLMDVKMILRNSFVYLASLSTIVLFVILIEYTITLFSFEVPVLIEFLLLIAAISVFPWFRNRYYHIANKYFFSSLYDSRQVIGKLSDKLRSTLEVDKLCNYISETLINTFHTKAVGILIRDKKGDNYRVQYNNGFQIGRQKRFPGNAFLHQKFIKQHKVVIVEEIKKEKNSRYKNMLNLLDKFGVEVLAPLNIKDKPLGLIVLGAKESKDMYNKEDLRVLHVIGAQVAIALQNAFLYQASLKFTQKLKREVECATHDLKNANLKLKKLDKTKTEFISIASHQLRTPMSGIKGYLSMLLEGDFGKLVPEQQKIIDDVYKNTDRLVRLVNLFLNVSRIEEGRLKLEKKEFNLVATVNTLFNNMKTDAVKKKLKYEFNTKLNKLPVLADQDKLSDVIINLIDNAIKYTEQGSVVVSLEKIGDKAKCSVKDSGVGIDPQEAQALFTKFTRGKKIAQINTSGSGLGLFIAKKIVEMHSGRIWVESEGEGKGATFIFEIPIA